MKTTIRLTALLCLLCLLGGMLCSCGMIAESWKTVRLTGEVVTDTYVLEDCTGEIALSVHLNFVNGGDNVITVRPTPEGMEPYCEVSYPVDFIEWGLMTHYDDGRLSVEIVPGRQGQRQFSTDEFAMTVYANVTDYDLVGNHALQADLGGEEISALKLQITGGAAVDMKNIAAEAVTVEVDGAADVVLSGTADKLETEINGAGVLDSGALTVRHGAVTVNGVGTADVNCTDALNVEINGAGTVQYRGEPELTKTINGLGTVSKIPDQTS